MARIKFYKNMFEDSFEEIEVKAGSSLKSEIEKYAPENPYASDMVECYDVETGKTYYAPLSDDKEDSVLITLNEKVISPDYTIKDTDLITVTFLPTSSSQAKDFWTGFLGFVTGGLVGALYGFAVGGIPGAVIGAFAGGVLGLMGGLAANELRHQLENGKKPMTRDEAKQVKKSPDVRGAGNISIINNTYPYVLGKHLISPLVVGAPITTYTDDISSEKFGFKINLNYRLFWGDHDDATIINNLSWSWIKKPNRKVDCTVTVRFYCSLYESDFNGGGYWHDEILYRTKKINLDGMIDGQTIMSDSSDSYFLDIWITRFEIAVDSDIRSIDAHTKEHVNDPYPIEITRDINENFDYQEKPTGNDAYISLLLCAGYGPLKLTDFKLDDFMLAYNRPTQNAPDRKTLMRGTLEGYSGSSGIADSGDILDVWKSNNVKIEILQHKPGDVRNRGTIYPLTKIQKEIGAQVLFVADKELEELAPVVYKGATFPNNFKTNNVYFTEGCPLSFYIEMEAPNGLYATRSVNSNNHTSIDYDPIPICYCIQWRPYNEENSSSDSTGGDYDSWNNITTFNGVDLGEVYTEELKNRDINTHKGNSFTDSARKEINKNFIDKTVVNFEKYSGSSFVKQMRFTAKVDLEDFARKHPDRFNFDMLVSNKKNKGRMIEIRFLRVSPSYINEISSSGDYGPYSYSDIVSVKTITTELFDDEVYKTENKKILPVYAIPRDSDLDEFCYIAIKAKADLNGYIQQSLDKVSCIAEAFAPQWDIQNKKWLPEGVKRVTKYYGFYKKDGVNKESLPNKAYRDTIKDKRINRDSSGYEIEISESEFIEARRDRLNWAPSRSGSNFADLIKDKVLTGTSTDKKCFLPDDCKFFNDNTSASGFMLSIVGAQNGITALGYEDINLGSLGQWYEDILELEDGSVDENNKPVKIKMEANAYLYQGEKLDSVLGKIASTGRAMFTYDDKGKIKIVMDKPARYPVGVISDQNCISSQDNYLYEEQPAGFVIEFKDENDGYEANTIYCWTDGNSYNNYKGQVVPYGIPYVTNPIQAWSLGRYMLASKLLNTVVLSRKIGPEGLGYNLGDMVMVQSDTLLIGDDSGRVQGVIESGDTIYGFVCDENYNYLGTLDSDSKCTQGVTINQPKQFGNSRVVTFRLAKPGYSVEIGDEKYTMKKGVTNIVLFDAPIKRDSKDNVDLYKYNFDTGDVCLFGQYGKVSAPFRITKIKQNEDNTFSETLVRYDESVYKYGAKLPSFQSYATRPPVQKDPISLSDVPSNLLELNNSNKGDTDLIYNKIDSITSNRVVNLYRRSKTLLTEDDLPKTPMEYDFTTDTLNPSSIDGWNFDYRTASQGEGSMFFTSATAFGKGTKYLIQPEKWNPPIVFGANGADGISGLNGLTIFIEKPALTFDSLDVEGNVSERIILDRVHMEVDGDPVPFTIGDVKAANPDVKGFDFSVYGEEVIIKVLPGAEMAKNGFILVPIISKNIIEKDYLIDEDNKRYVDENGHTYGTFKQGDEDVEYKLYVSYAKAEKGEKGEPGKSILTVVEYYCVTTEKIAPAKKDFTEGLPPEITREKPYLWNYEISYYDTEKTDKASETNVSLIGSFGKDGAQVESITEMYLVTDKAEGVTKEDTGWSETNFQTTIKNKYLWNYEKITLTDGSVVETEPARIGVHGETGAKGEEGEQGPSYLGMFDKPAAEVGPDFPIGSWYLNTVDGKIYLRQKNEAEPWIDLKLLVGPEKYYSDYRVQAAINDIFTITANDKGKYPDLVIAANAWCDNLVANTAFIDTLSSNTAFVETLSSSTAFIDNLVSRQAFIDKLGIQDIVLKVLGSIKSENYVENKSGTILKADGYFESQNAKIRGSLTSNNFTKEKYLEGKYQTVKSGYGFHVDSGTGVAEVNELICSEDITIPSFDIQQKELRVSEYGEKNGITLTIKQDEYGILKDRLDTLFEDPDAFLLDVNDPWSRELFCFIASGNVNNTKVTEDCNAGSAICRRTINGVQTYYIVGSYGVAFGKKSKDRVIIEGDSVIEDDTLAWYLTIRYKAYNIKINAPSFISTKLYTTMGRYYESIFLFNHGHKMHFYFVALEGLNMEFGQTILECYALCTPNSHDLGQQRFIRCSIRRYTGRYEIFTEKSGFTPINLTDDIEKYLYIDGFYTTDLLI